MRGWIATAAAAAMLSAGACGKQETPSADSKTPAPPTVTPPQSATASAGATSVPVATGTTPGAAGEVAGGIEAFRAALPQAGQTQWYLVGARGRMFVAKLTRAEKASGVTAEMYVTGAAAGVQTFSGAVPGGRAAPVVLLAPVDASKAGQVLIVLLTASPDTAGRIVVTAVLEDRTLTTLAPTDELRALATIAPILKDAPSREKVLARAAELKAVDYARNGFGVPPAAGSEVLVVIQADKEGRSVYGSGPYTSDSDVRRAAVHAGVAKDGEWAIVRVKFIDGPETHPGSTKNGVKTGAWAKFAVSYTLERVD